MWLLPTYCQLALPCLQKFFRSASDGGLSQAVPEMSIVHPQLDLYAGQVIKVQLVQETAERPTELRLGSTRVASRMVDVSAHEMGDQGHQFLACLGSPDELGEHRLVTNLGHSTGALVRYHGHRFVTCP